MMVMPKLSCPNVLFPVLHQQIFPFQTTPYQQIYQQYKYNLNMLNTIYIFKYHNIPNIKYTIVRKFPDGDILILTPSHTLPSNLTQPNLIPFSTYYSTTLFEGVAFVQDRIKKYYLPCIPIPVWKLSDDSVRINYNNVYFN